MSEPEKTQKVRGEAAQTLQRVLLLVASCPSTHVSGSSH